MAEPNLVSAESDGVPIMMWLPRDDIDSVLERVWMAALDAKECLRERGGTETAYINKERNHMLRAREELDAIYWMRGQPG